MSVIDGLRELEAAATQGPWHRALEWDEETERHTKPSVIHPLGEIGCEDIPDTLEDAALIATMRNALPLLLDVVEAAGPFTVAGFMAATAEEVKRLRAAWAALESAQGAEQRPETGAGA